MGKMRSTAIVLAAIAFVAELFPQFTGIDVHEWFGAAACFIMLAHAIMSFRASAPRGDLVLDALVFVSFAACMVTGIMISGSLLPTFGLYVSSDFYFWSLLHAASAKLMLALLVLHALSHVKVIGRLLRRA